MQQHSEKEEKNMPWSRFEPTISVLISWLSLKAIVGFQFSLKNADSSQTKLLGQSLSIGEHGIGYLNLAFLPIMAKKCQYSALSP